MNNNYMAGFSKVAQDNGFDSETLMKLAERMSFSSVELNKQADYGQLARLITKMSPKVDPSKLNWFTKLFTTTRSNPVRMSLARRLNRGAVRGTSGHYGSTEGAATADILNDLAENASRTTTRVSPGKILGTAGVAGTIAQLINRYRDKSVSDSTTPSPASADLFSGLTDQQKKYLILGALGVGTLGLGAAGGALLRS